MISIFFSYTFQDDDVFSSSVNEDHSLASLRKTELTRASSQSCHKATEHDVTNNNNNTTPRSSHSSACSSRDLGLLPEAENERDHVTICTSRDTTAHEVHSHGMSKKGVTTWVVFFGHCDAHFVLFCFLGRAKRTCIM